MTMGIAFWVLFILWIVLGFWPDDGRLVKGRSWLLVALIGLLGWHSFGFIIQG